MKVRWSRVRVADYLVERYPLPSRFPVVVVHYNYCAVVPYTDVRQEVFTTQLGADFCGWLSCVSFGEYLHHWARR